MSYLGRYLSLNLKNLKSSGLKFLFGIINSLNYREVDIKIYNPKNDYFHFIFFFNQTLFWHVKELSHGDVSLCTQNICYYTDHE